MDILADDITMSQYSDTVYKLFDLFSTFIFIQASLVPQGQRIHLTMQKYGFDLWVEEEMATYSNILPRKIRGQRSLVGYRIHAVRRVGHDLVTKTTADCSSLF